MTWYSVRTLNCPSIIRSDDENFSSKPSSVSRTFELFLVASVRTSQQHGRTPFSVQQGKRLRSKTQIWEESCNHPDDVCSLPNTILDKARRAYKVQPSRCQTSWFGHSRLNMEIACSRSETVRTLGQHHPDAALFRKEYRTNLESRLHSCPSERRLGNSSQTRIWIPVAYK